MNEYKKIEPSLEVKYKILEDIVKEIFGYNVKLDFSRYSCEADNLTIENINYEEDLLGVLERLRDKFFVYLNTDDEIGEIDFNGKKEKHVHSWINVELTRRNQ